MRIQIKKLLIINILTTVVFCVWFLLTPSLSSERVFLSYSSYRLMMNVIAIFTLVIFLICLWALRFQRAQRIFEEIFLSRWFTLFILVVITILFQALIFYLKGEFGDNAIYYEKLSPLLLLVLVLCIEMLGFQYHFSNGEVIWSLYNSVGKIVNDKSPIVIGVILLAYFMLIFFSLSSGHNWGDDFAHYLSQATSLLNGTVDEFIQGRIFTITNSPNEVSPVTVPWGFPIYLLPFIKIFDQNILALKLSNVVAYTAFLIVTYIWASLRLSKPASILIMGFFTVSPIFIQFHNQVLSDLFFLFLSMTSLLLIDIFIKCNDKKVWIGILLGFTIFYASFSRTSGFLLIGTLLIAQIAIAFTQRKKTKQIEISKLIVAFIPYLVFAFFYILQKVLLQNEQLAFSPVIDKVSLQTIFNQIDYYFLQLQEIFAPLFLSKLLFYFSIPLVIFGIYANRKSLSSWIAIIYAGLTLGMYIVFPERQGIRYLFPIIPIYILYIVLGGKSLLEMTKTKHNPAFIFILFLAVFSIAAQFGLVNRQYAILNMSTNRIERHGPYYPQTMDVFEYVRDSTESDSIIVFFKPRAMNYLSNRNSFIMNSCEGLGCGDYLVWLTGERVQSNPRQMSFEELQGCIAEKRVNLVFSNDEGSVFEIVHE